MQSNKEFTSKKKQNILFIHGFGANSLVFEPVFRSLPKNYVSYFIDLPGFGKTKAIDKINIDSLALYIMDKYPRNSIVVAWSLGGLIAQKIALIEPNFIKQLIFISSTPRFVEDKNWFGISKQFLFEFKKNLIKNKQKTLTNFIVLQTLGEKNQKQIVNFLKNISRENNQLNTNNLLDYLDVLEQIDHRDKIKNITIPMRFIYGSLDKIVSQKNIKFLPENAKTIVLEEASHIAFLSNKPKFLKIILQLIQNKTI